MTTRTTSKILPFLTGAAVVLGGAATAEASSGWVTGTLRFHNKNGGFCPSGEDCTGARYLESAHDVAMPIPEAVVKIRRSSDDVVIGSGTTDASGNYLVSWSSGAGTGSVGIRVQVWYQHKDGRFRLHTVNNLPHTQYGSTSAVFTATHGSTSGSPQSLGGWVWGTSAAPSAVANVYWASWMLWQNGLKNSNRMLSFFTDIDVLAFDTANLTGCTTSCARGWFKNMTTATGTPAWAHELTPTIVLDGGVSTPYGPTWRATHELGHVADYLSGPNQGLRRETGYGFGGGTGWNTTTDEFRPTALTEGIATLVGSVAFYADSATDPRTCIMNGDSANPGQWHCYPGAGSTLTTWSLEDSNFGSCGATEGRQPLSAMRFFWDIIDQTNDATETTNLSLANVFDSLAAWPCPGYPSCFGTNELHDQYSSISATLASTTVPSGNEDIGHAWQFRFNMLNNYVGAFDVQNPYFSNCMGFF